MYLENEKTNHDMYYSIGYSPELGKYILACTITWVTWYKRYYEISKEEYALFGTKKLDEIAKTLYEQGCASERFLFSEKKEENSKKNAES